MQKSGMKSISSLANLGCQFLCEAKIPDVTQLFIDVGLNINVEMSQIEALHFIPKRIKVLNIFAIEISNKIAKLQADLRIINAGVGIKEKFGEQTKL
ncbi:MAG: hypothetical protein EZS28_025330 [Streblomastix strix]|uniref:Uncharacterized protein n=1 Tax=Streblomastix strix TaxID=222440 RepID=A0A5J4V9H4_9EUKA|nr:MAG: hypothetical protein EZS28_025330 [Streblomastix strix]